MRQQHGQDNNRGEVLEGGAPEHSFKTKTKTKTNRKTETKTKVVAPEHNYKTKTETNRKTVGG